MIRTKMKFEEEENEEDSLDCFIKKKTSFFQEHSFSVYQCFNFDILKKIFSCVRVPVYSFLSFNISFFVLYEKIMQWSAE